MDFQYYLDLTTQFVKFKSISTDPAFQSEIHSTVNWLKELFDTNGFTTELWLGEKTNPVVFASIVVNPVFETILVYGHYDVQPADQADGWDTDPFSLAQKEDRLYARGVVDNKGQVMIHIATVLSLLKENKLFYNVKFLIEGNEETSNPEIAELIVVNKAKIAADYILISDGEIIGDNPVVEFSLRGGFNCKLMYKTAQNNLHSGIFGGVVPNAATELADFVSKIFDKKYKVKIPDFYDAVDEIPQAVLENNKKLSTPKAFMKSAGVQKLFVQRGLDVYSQVGLMPAISVTGFKSGYIGDGYSNIVPNTAEVRLNFRTVSTQNYQDVIEGFKKYVKKKTRPYIEYELEFNPAHNPVKIDISAPKVGAVEKMLTTAFGKEVLIKPVGGAIPVVSDFKEHLGLDCLLISLGNEDCNMHGVNENFKIDIINKGLKFSEMFFSRI